MLLEHVKMQARMTVNNSSSFHFTLWPYLTEEWGSLVMQLELEFANLCFVKEHCATEKYHSVFNIIGKNMQFFGVFLDTNIISATGSWLVSKEI